MRRAFRTAVYLMLLMAVTSAQATFEDFYGPTGDRFQGAISFINFQAVTDDIDAAAQSFGLAIDDMEVEWEEFVLVDDATDCASSGSCATIALDRTNFFTGNSIISVTVIDAFPYGEDGANDCDFNGSFGDGVDDTDCDDDGTDDVTANFSSEVEPFGENVICNATGSPNEYSCQISTSTIADIDGVLFLTQVGTDEPTISVRYDDLWDGRSIRICANPTDPEVNNAGFVCLNDGHCTNSTCELSPCQNDVDPIQWGIIETSSSVFVPACAVNISGATFTDNGDGDDFGDTNETLDVDLSFSNACGSDLTNCIARLASNSPEVDCITDGTIVLGDLPADAVIKSATLADSFSFKVADVNRTDVFADFTADFLVTVGCDQIDTTVALQEFSITLDLDLQSSGVSIPWAEGFESANPVTPGDFASFVPDDIDAGVHPEGPGVDPPLILADGMRCQYSDPDNPDSGPFGGNNAQFCYPGYNLSHASKHWWEINGTDDTCTADSGRAYEGTQSLYFGSCIDSTLGYTTPSGHLEAVKSDLPINLGVGNPVLSFKHQVSLMRSPEEGGAINITPGTTSGRAIVSLQIAGDFCAGGPNDGNGCDPDVGGSDCPGGVCAQNVAAGPWIKLNPFQNVYTNTNYDFFNACMFDPIDDGSTEDDFFNPADPLDEMGLPHGPSSTCNPELVWAGIGDTDEPFDMNNVQNAEPNSGLEGSLIHPGSGTWVQSAFDLSGYRGRRVRLRFLTTDLKATVETWEAQFFPFNPDPADDGWWIDDLQIDDSLAEPATFVIDTNPNQVVSQGGTFPECGNPCNSVTVLTDTDPSPATLPAPGQPLEINAVDSFADACISGIVQYRFSTAGGQELRGWTDNPVILVAPAFTTDYVVEARCSSLISCNASSVVTATVNCPTSVVTPTAFGETIFAEANKNEFSWATSKPHAAYTGDLSVVSSYTGAFVSSGEGSSFVDSSTPAPGSGFYYVVRNGQFCNDAGLWTGGGIAEFSGRETGLP